MMSAKDDTSIKKKTTKSSKPAEKNQKEDQVLSDGHNAQPRSKAKEGDTPNQDGASAEHMDLRSTIAESMKQGFQELASMLQSVNGAKKRSLISSDSENSSSENEGDVSRRKKHKADKGAHSGEVGANSSPVDVEKEIDALLNAGNTEENPSSADKGVFDSILQEYELEEVLSSPVSDNLATIVNKMARSKIPDDKLKEKLNQYTRPQNCEKLVTPKVNSEIWAKISSSTRSRDLKLQKIQTTLMKVTSLIVGLNDKFIKERTDNNTIKAMFDCLALISHANTELSYRRRDFIKPDLNAAYQQICSEQMELTDNLFGDDLAQKIKDITATNRVANTLLDKNKQSKSYRYDNRKHYSSKNEGRAGWKNQTSYNRYRQQRQYNYPSKKKEGEKTQK